MEEEEEGLEYLGCFRDHPNDLREFYDVEGLRNITTGSEQQEEEAGGEDNVYVLPGSLTPNVRETLSCVWVCVYIYRNSSRLAT